MTLFSNESQPFTAVVMLDTSASMTANLNQQVIANPTLVRSLSDTIVHADQFVQGLKRFFLFRHLFPNPPASTTGSTNAAPSQPTTPLRSPKGQGG